MLPRATILLLASLAGSATAAELSVDDLRRGSERARGVVLACEAGPSACADPETRATLARAFYTLALDAVIHGRPVDRQIAANVKQLDAALYAHLPAGARSHEADPSPWVVQLLVERPPRAVAQPRIRRPAPVPEPEPEVEPEPELPDDLPTALAFLEDGPPEEASRRLLHLSVSGDRDALFHLSRAAERLNLPATSLILRADWLRAAESDPRASGAASDAVRLAAVVGSRQPLIDLARELHPSLWDPAVRSDGWLALGQGWQADGEHSRALKAYSAIPRDAAAYARGEYQTGVIFWQSSKPWEAIEAFDNAWEAAAEDIDDERVREMALWSSARLYEELQRPDEAMGRYEVLAISPSPLSERAAYRCAWIAQQSGDAKLATRWLAPTLPAGVFRPDYELLKARIALSTGDRRAAVRHIDAADPQLRALSKELADLLAHSDGLWTRLHAADRNPVIAARLDADPQIAAYRAHLAALRADRKALAANPDPEWRASVGRVLDGKLLDQEIDVRFEATAIARQALAGIQRELAALQREVVQLRKRHDG